MASSPLLKKSPITQSSVRATVSVNGAKSQEWESASGGGKTAQVQKVRVGYSPDKVTTIPSVSDSGDVTVIRHMVVSSCWDYQAYLLEQVGIGTAKVWMTPMDALGADDYAAAQDVTSLVYEGLITAVSPVSADNESTGMASFSMTISGGPWKASN
jgi:hypothetical protein